MSDTTVAAKPAKASATPKAPVSMLRQAQLKKFKPSSLQELGHDHSVLTISVPSDWTYEDLLNPGAWTNVCGMVAKDALNTRRDKIGSLIFARAEGSFIAWLSIEGVILDGMNNPSGLNVQCMGPSVNLETGEPCPLDLKTRRPLISKPVKAA